jgi:hypothetical protein
MNEVQFTQALRDSAPVVSAPETLGSHSERIIAEGRTRRSRRARSWIGAVVVMGVLAGGTSVAVAGDGRETPWGWVAENVFSIEQPDAEVCFQGTRVMFEGVAADSPIVEDARDIARSIDIDQVNLAPIEGAIRREHAAAKDLNGKPAPMVESRSQVKQAAVHKYIFETVMDELEARGYPTSSSPISIASQTMGCN